MDSWSVGTVRGAKKVTLCEIEKRILRDRLMVGRGSLKAEILVRFQVPQQMKKVREIITEDFVQKSVIKHLEKNGWSKSLQSKELWEQGVDIKVCNNKFSRYWLVEAKGDPSEKVKSPAGSQSSSFNSALGQIITRMHRNGKRGYKYGYKYGIAFPTSFRKMDLRKIPFDVMDKLNLYLFFVDSFGVVEEIDWKKIRDIKNEY